MPVYRLSPESLPYRMMLDNFIPTATLRSLANCFRKGKNGRKILLPRDKCLMIAHSMFDEITHVIMTNRKKELIAGNRSRLGFLFPNSGESLIKLWEELQGLLPATLPLNVEDDGIALRLQVNRGQLTNQFEYCGIGVHIYRHGVIAGAYRGYKLWLIPLTSREIPTRMITGRKWIPFLVLFSSRATYIGASIRLIIDQQSDFIEVSAYSPAGLLLIGINDILNALEARVFGARQITKQMPRLMTLIEFLLYDSRASGPRAISGYRLIGEQGLANQFAHNIYTTALRLNSRNSTPTISMIYLKGLRYRIVTYSDKLAIDSSKAKADAAQIAAELLGYDNALDLLQKLASGEAQHTITYMVIRRLIEDLNPEEASKLIGRDRIKPSLVERLTKSYIGIITGNASLHFYSSMSEEAIQKEIDNIIRPAILKLLADQTHTNTLEVGEITA